MTSLKQVCDDNNLTRQRVQSRQARLGIAGKLKKAFVKENGQQQTCMFFTDEEVDRLLYICPDDSLYVTREEVLEYFDCPLQHLAKLTKGTKKYYFNVDGSRVRHFTKKQFEKFKKEYKVPGRGFGSAASNNRWDNLYGSPMRINPY